MAENEKQNIKNDPAYAEKAALAVKTVTAVIPSYKPDEKLMKVICGLEEAGFDDILLKPVTRDKLVELLAKEAR